MSSQASIAAAAWASGACLPARHQGGANLRARLTQQGRAALLAPGFAALLAALFADGVEAPKAPTFQEVLEHDVVRHLAVPQGLDGDRVLQHPRRGQQLTDARPTDGAPGLVDLDMPRGAHADHPDEPGAGGEELANLGR